MRLDRFFDGLAHRHAAPLRVVSAKQIVADPGEDEGRRVQTAWRQAIIAPERRDDALKLRIADVFAQVITPTPAHGADHLRVGGADLHQ